MANRKTNKKSRKNRKSRKGGAGGIGILGLTLLKNDNTREMIYIKSITDKNGTEYDINNYTFVLPLKFPDYVPPASKSTSLPPESPERLVVPPTNSSGYGSFLQDMGR